MQFTEWVREPVPPGTDIVLCVVDDAAVAAALEDTTRGRTIPGHPVTVRSLIAGEPMPNCQLLYLSGSNLKQSLDAIAIIKDSVVLTVGQAQRFAERGGMVELFVETGRFRFAVHTDALNRGGVRLSSRLLALATIVTDGKPD